jgi:hypothetical protein
MSLQSLDLGGGVASFGLDPGQTIRSSGESGIVLVELSGKGLLSGSRICKLGPSGFEFASSE